jgi:phosphopantetheinyl transferase
MPVNQLIYGVNAPLPGEISLSWSGMEGLKAACLGLILLTIEPLLQPEEQCLTFRELARMESMGPRRRMNFMSARVALKRLTRQLGLVEQDRTDRTIETLGPDDQKPCLGETKLCCSVSHQARIVVAVAHNHPVGVDLEQISEKALRVLRTFGIEKEQKLVSYSPLGTERAATRIWTSKEAASKALDLHLFQALQEVEVVSIGEKEGLIRFQGKPFPVKHCENEGQLMTLITCDGEIG